MQRPASDNPDRPGLEIIHPDGGLSPSEWIALQAQRQGYTLDAAQQEAVRHLQRLHDELTAREERNRSALAKWFGRKPAPVKGLYFWGGVGRGKSFLMDSFYASSPIKQKRRLHFHHFMQEVHHQLKNLSQKADPLQLVAQNIAADTKLLCFDEFHVNDIADAMILGRLLEALLANDVIVVMTSNYKPDDLYQYGLQRHRFFPAIEFIKANHDVVNVDGGTDYRLRTLERIDVFHHPLDDEGESKLAHAFAEMTGGSEEAPEIEIEGRTLTARRRARGIIWFDFQEICGGPRSQIDYLELAREYHTVVVSNIPRMGAEHASEARRFTWLVDVFYDNRVKLLATAEVPPEELYTSGPMSGEFFRTVSRLQEMQSREYLSLAHVALVSAYNTI